MLNSREGRNHDFLLLMKKLNLVKLQKKYLNFEFGIFFKGVKHMSDELHSTIGKKRKGSYEIMKSYHL